MQEVMTQTLGEWMDALDRVTNSITDNHLLTDTAFLRAEIEKINPVTQDTWAAGVLHCKNRILSLLDKEASK